jgi:hypothetical protein
MPEPDGFGAEWEPVELYLEKHLHHLAGTTTPANDTREQMMTVITTFLLFSRQEDVKEDADIGPTIASLSWMLQAFDRTTKLSKETPGRQVSYFTSAPIRMLHQIDPDNHNADANKLQRMFYDMAKTTLDEIANSYNRTPEMQNIYGITTINDVNDIKSYESKSEVDKSLSEICIIGDKDLTRTPCIALRNIDMNGVTPRKYHVDPNTKRPVFEQTPYERRNGIKPLFGI